MREAVIVSAVRTPIGKFRGTLASIPAHELGGLVVKEAVKRAKIDPAEIDEVIFSNLMNHEVNNMGRMVSLDAGLPTTVPGITLDRQCGSSLNSFAYAAILVQGGYADTIVAGGVESDSRRTYTMEKPTAAYQFAPPAWSEIKVVPDEYENVSMGITAENLAEKYSLTRDECDEFALLSHKKAAKAWASGYFNEQIVSVNVPQGKGKYLTFAQDEIVRPELTLEQLASLPPAFKKGGIVTAGNSSPLSDGAGAVVVMEKGKAIALGLDILATFKGYTSVGVEPRIMGIGPVAATRKLLGTTKITINDIDLIEMNEAFSAQSLPCIRELNINMDKLNVNGGALALGHPLAGTGAILLTKMVYEMKRRQAQTGLISFCCGGGMGVAVLLENR